MNDYINNVTVKCASADLHKVTDVVKDVMAEVEGVETKIVETVEVSYVSRGLGSASATKIESATNEAGLTCHVNWEVVDLSEAHEATLMLKELWDEFLPAQEDCDEDQALQLDKAHWHLDMADICAQYSQWQDFKDHLGLAESTVEDCFPNAFPNTANENSNMKEVA